MLTAVVCRHTMGQPRRSGTLTAGLPRERALRDPHSSPGDGALPSRRTMLRKRTVGLLAAGVAVVTALTLNQLGFASAATTLDPTVAPGGNFNLSVWQLQLPIGSAGAPTTIQPAQLKGAGGYTNPTYFWTDKKDGSMTFWDPEKGVTTPNSSY